MHDTVVFEGPPVTEQRLWPTHCVQGSWGAEIHTDLKVDQAFGTYQFLFSKHFPNVWILDECFKYNYMYRNESMICIVCIL